MQYSFQGIRLTGNIQWAANDGLSFAPLFFFPPSAGVGRLDLPIWIVWKSSDHLHFMSFLCQPGAQFAVVFTNSGQFGSVIDTV